MPRLMGWHIGGYLRPRPRHTWWSRAERRSMGSPMVDSRWLLAPSVRFPWLGAAQAGQVDTHRSPRDAASNTDQWVPPWPIFDRFGVSASGSPDWVRLHQDKHRRILLPYPDDATTVSHRTNLFLTVCVTSGTSDSRLARFSPEQRKPNILTGRRYRSTEIKESAYDKHTVNRRFLTPTSFVCFIYRDYKLFNDKLAHKQRTD